MTTESEIVVKKGLGEFTVVVVISLIFAGSCAMALSNLVNQVAMLPSGLWIGLVSFLLIVNLREVGFRAFCISLLAAFCRRQSLRVRAATDGPELEVGFKLLAVNVVERRIPADDLVTIEWNTGQASDMAGRDVGDWSVLIWYRHRDFAREARERELGRRRPGEAVLAIGPPQPKQIAESLGHHVLAFLHNRGIAVSTTLHDGPSPPNSR